MMWLKMNSWHIFGEWSKTDEHVAITLCGRRKWLADGTLDSEPDLDDKTCETCFRVNQRQEGKSA